MWAIKYFHWTIKIRLNITSGKERSYYSVDEFAIYKLYLRQCSERFPITYATMEALETFAKFENIFNVLILSQISALYSVSAIHATEPYNIAEVNEKHWHTVSPAQL